MGRFAKRQLYDAIHDKYRSQLGQLRAETKRAKKAAYAECGSRSWTEWLQEQAKTGRVEAVEALRKRAFSLAKANGAALRGEASPSPGIMPGEKIADVTKGGTIIYDVGMDAVRDDGESFRVGARATIETDIMALRLAQRRFGDIIVVDGDNAFRRRMVKAAVEGKVSIKFADLFMERRRNEMFIDRYQDGERDRQRESHGRENVPTGTGRMAPPLWRSIAGDARNPTRGDGKAAKDNEPEREKPGGRGMSR